MDTDGTPYHRLARTAAHRWWRHVLGTVAVLAGAAAAAVGVLVAAATVGLITGRREGRDGIPSFGAIGDTAVLLACIAAATPIVLLTAWLIQRRPPGTVASVTGRLRLGWLGICLLVALPVIVLTVLGAWVLLGLSGAPMESTEVEWVGGRTFLLSVAMLVALVPLQSAAEEFLFRGWLLQAIGAFVRSPWPAIVVPALLFAAAHGWGTPWGFADLVVFGVLAGWLTVRTGGLEAAIALHVVNNLVAMSLAAAFGELDSDATAADSPWQLVAVDVIMLSLYALVVQWLAGRWRIAATSAPPAPPIGGEQPRTHERGRDQPWPGERAS